MATKILIINGPNLNLLGKREENHYGKTTFEDLKKDCHDYAKNKDVELAFKQTNIEGEIADKKKYNKIFLKKNDKIEIVQFIGGG